MRNTDAMNLLDWPGMADMVAQTGCAPSTATLQMYWAALVPAEPAAQLWAGTT